MFSDPQVGSNEAWSSPGSPHENGDICNGQTRTITVGANTWTVQLMYSKWHDINTYGATTCISETPNPLGCSCWPPQRTCGSSRNEPVCLVLANWVLKEATAEDAEIAEWI
jgi:hypothetical protein